MDDEDWMIEDPNESQPEPAPEEAPAEAAVEEAAAAEAEPEAVVEGTNGPKRLIYKHWVRPKFLQYGYMYDYRRNYYDDVINYLDRRNRGLITEVPRAQTWAERALRTYVSKSDTYASRASRNDVQLLHHISAGARFHRYHSKSLISRKYSTLGFNTVSI